MVRGEKRRGLIIDPGAASGLIGSETLRDIIATCVQPYGKSSDVAIDTSVTSPVSGISGSSDRTLGKVTIPLVTAGLPISFTGEIIGGEGSLCPALVGNPSLRSLRSTIFTSYFENGDGLLTLDSRKEDDDPIKMMRILLTDSGHYILPVDYDETGKVSTTTRREVAAFFNKVAEAATNQWNDVDPRTRHIFMNKTASYGEGDRGEIRSEQHEQEQEELCDGLQEVHDQPEVQRDENNMMEEDLEKASQQEQQQPGDAGILLAEEVSTTMTSAMAKESKKVSKVSHVRYDETVWEPRGQQDQGGEQEAQTPLEQFHTEEDFPLYNGDIFPEDVEKNNLAKKYRAMPEEYYTRSGLRPITPWNFRKWFDQAKGKKLRWHFWEIFSGSGRLSLIMLLAGLTVGFPIDMRYGWNINNHSHQNMLKEARDEFCPGVVFLAPECGPWSVSSSSKKPEDRQADRLRDGPSVRWVQDTCWEQSRCGRGYAVEQPLGSAMWRPEDGSPLHLDLIHDNRQKQRVDQCMHGSQDEEGNPVQKATGLGSNIKFNATAKRCSGHKMADLMPIFEDKHQTDSIALPRRQFILELCARGFDWMWWLSFISGSCFQFTSGRRRSVGLSRSTSTTAFVANLVEPALATSSTRWFLGNVVMVFGHPTRTPSTRSLRSQIQSRCGRMKPGKKSWTRLRLWIWPTSTWTWRTATTSRSCSLRASTMPWASSARLFTRRWSMNIGSRMQLR